MRRITAHVLVLFGGGNIFGYSPGVRGALDIRSQYGIRPNQRIVVATMSSYDELFAAQIIGAVSNEYHLLFPGQLEWIDAVVRFVQRRDDLFLLIRVHPREFPNKRDSVKSQHAALLEAAFARLPLNVRVNWPADQISLYDLADQTDVFLNAWSSAGKEMSLLGIPVVIYSPDLISYPADLNYLGTTETEFFQHIDTALETGWSLERSRLAYRWLAVEFGHGVIDISDGYREAAHTEQSFGSRMIERLRWRMDPRFIQKRDCDGRAANLAARPIIERMLRFGATTPLDPAVCKPIPTATAEAEDRALRTELARIGKALCGHARTEASRGLAARLLGLDRATPASPR